MSVLFMSSISDFEKQGILNYGCDVNVMDTNGSIIVGV